MLRQESADRIREIGEEITELLIEARLIAEEQGLDVRNLDAYVFNQIQEHIENQNPYNQSMEMIAVELEKIQ